MENPRIRRVTIDELRRIAGAENVLTSDEDRICYAYDGQSIEHRPDAIVRPADSEQISQVLVLANQECFPVVPRGAGTGLSGGSVPACGGVVLDLTRMSSVVEVGAENLHITVQPGVVTAALAAEAEKHGLLYAPDPGSMKVSTIGGNVAENAGGLRAIKYGVTRDYLMQVQAVAPTGESFQSGARTHKCVVGYDLGSLLCGSEGTLGVVTEVTLRLVPMPECRKSMTAMFSSASAAGTAVAGIMAARLTPATLEIIDNFTLRRIEEHARLGLPIDAGAMLLVEFDGSPSAVDAEAGACEALLRAGGSDRIETADDPETRDRIWEARRVALAALSRARPTTFLEDVTVPLPNLAAMIEAVERIARENDLPIGTFGHAGDGNLHPTILSDRRDESEMARAEKAIEQIMQAALDLGGTLSGEHGVGLAKSPFLADEVGAPSIEIMRRIKKALDPNNILNPGKFL